MPVQLSGYETNATGKTLRELTVTKIGDKTFLDTLPFFLPLTRAYDNAGRSDGQPVYVGYALPGTAKTAAGWAIMKTTYDSSGFVTDEQWADGDANFNNVWNDRASGTYT